MSDESLVIKQRREKAEQLEKDNISLYPNDVKTPDSMATIRKLYDSYNAEALEKVPDSFRLAGRIMSLRRFGKAAFLHLQDSSGQLQVHVRRDMVGTEAYSLFKKLDIGDLIEVKGRLFRTR
ncbi:MAG: lysine--tRNA ligase, partial [Deltaproteobacteria bacterium]|nr:lysine--tRNA ligase [Deltaproteobacteria bacterium]MBW1933660.1 lysine--tRNA ligase [Deltaproteobacteria bacterium]